MTIQHGTHAKPKPAKQTSDEVKPTSPNDVATRTKNVSDKHREDLEARDQKHLGRKNKTLY